MLESGIVRRDDGIAIVNVKGRLVLGSSLSLLEAQITTLNNEGVKKLVLDLEKVDYADSAGLGVLLHTSAAVRAGGGQLLLAGPNKRLAELFDLTNTRQLLGICPDVAACIEQLK